MQTLSLPYSFYSFASPENEVSSNLSSLFELLISDYSVLLDDVYRSEIFGLDTDPYSPINDISILISLLVSIHWEISVTAENDLLTYQEYLEKYHADCIIEYIRCRYKKDVWPLIIAFDSGYTQPSNTPDTLGIGDFIIHVDDVDSDLDLTIQ